LYNALTVQAVDPPAKVKGFKDRATATRQLMKLLARVAAPADQQTSDSTEEEAAPPEATEAEAVPAEARDQDAIVSEFLAMDKEREAVKAKAAAHDRKAEDYNREADALYEKADKAGEQARDAHNDAARRKLRMAALVWESRQLWEAARDANPQTMGWIEWSAAFGKSRPSIDRFLQIGRDADPAEKARQQRAHALQLEQERAQRAKAGKSEPPSAVDSGLPEADSEIPPTGEVSQDSARSDHLETSAAKLAEFRLRQFENGFRALALNAERLVEGALKDTEELPKGLGKEVSSELASLARARAREWSVVADRLHAEARGLPAPPDKPIGLPPPAVKSTVPPAP
jgi:hypothetical protein